MKSNKIKCIICGNEDKRRMTSTTAIGDVCLNCTRLMFKKKITSSYMKHYDLDELRKMILSTEDANSNTAKYKYFLKGTNGQLYVYENKIEITRKGFFALATQGVKGVKTIPLSEIKSIQLKLAGAMVGYIQFAVGGGIEGQRGVREANYDENTITFNAINNKKAQDIKNYIENLILNKTNSQTATVSTTSVADEIKKYKELLDIGAITQDEFECKKKQLLGL